jgi:hypothetical protein
MPNTNHKKEANIATSGVKASSALEHLAERLEEQDRQLSKEQQEASDIR